MSSIHNIAKERKKCTGCLACMNICPHSAIVIREDVNGFDYPELNKEKCVHCGLCAKICPANISEREPLCITSAYAVTMKDEQILLKSSSGGAFAAISKLVFDKGGVVFGCVWDDNFRPIHAEAHNYNEMKYMHGSKYVQSRIGDTYKRVKQFLTDKQWVLFTGTPCQVSGLKNFLRRKYDNLITVDIICHGVPSYKLFKGSLEQIQNEKEGTLKEYSYSFRSKHNASWGMNIQYIINDKNYFETPNDSWFLSYFLWGYIYRDSCYQCAYAGTERVGDFTIGDYFAIQHGSSKLRNKNGVSLLLCNTEQGLRFLPEILSCVEYVKLNKEEAVLDNAQLLAPVKNRKFFRNVIYNIYNRQGWKGVDNYFHKKTLFKRLKSLIKYTIKKGANNEF